MSRRVQVASCVYWFALLWKPLRPTSVNWRTKSRNIACIAMRREGREGAVATEMREGERWDDVQLECSCPWFLPPYFEGEDGWDCYNLLHLTWHEISCLCKHHKENLGPWACYSLLHLTWHEISYLCKINKEKWGQMTCKISFVIAPSFGEDGWSGIVCCF